ncbi:hypothetical protein [Thiomicrorhabdus cannonii]|uniref:hypothetical protein n=1 Tax=Thiomicrorhabdus cannonii TaxID=2748011 RepID=UPI0015BB1A3D|nr:hypothetical protein [Thiomicrorhabdus cannonii]
MTADEIRKLGEAITLNAGMLAEMDWVEETPIEIFDATQSLGLLKNARIIEPIDDSSYFPGENYDLLRKAINSSNYELRAMPDIVDWLNNLRHLSDQYAAASDEQRQDEEVQVRKAIFRNIHHMSSDLKSLIREIDLKATAEFGYCKTLEAKIRENRHYQARTQDIIEKLERLNYKQLMKISSNSEVEQITLGKFFPKIEGLRQDLLRVLNKLQKLSLSFQETERRTKRLRRILVALDEKQFISSNVLERIDYLNSEHLNAISPRAIGVLRASYDYKNGTAFNNSRFEDISRKIRLPEKTIRQLDDFEPAYLDTQDSDAIPEEPMFKQEFLACKTRFIQRLVKQSHSMSVVNFWEEDIQTNTLISANAWLCDMVAWLSDVKGGLDPNYGRIDIGIVETPVSAKSDIHLISDIEVHFIPGEANAIK